MLDIVRVGSGGKNVSEGFYRPGIAMPKQCQNPHCRRFVSDWYIKVVRGKAYRFRRAKPRKYCNNKCQGMALRGTGKSYIMIWVDGKRIYLHIWVMEQKLGRKLLPGEIVHHIDENHHHNHPSNLELATDRADHLAKHNWHRRLEKPVDLEQMQKDVDEWGW